MHRHIALALVLACTGCVASARADIVYAVSNGSGRVIRYNAADPVGTTVTLSGTGLIVGAAGLALGPDGNLYIGESGNFSTVAPSIRRLDVSTNVLSTVYTFADFDVFPGALLFKGNDLLVGRNPFFGDTGAVVRVANATGGTVSVSDYTSGGSLASSPGLAFGSDGSLYVSSQTYNFVTGTATGPVEKFDSAGVYVGTLITGGSATGLFGPTGLGIRGDTLFVSSIMNGAALQTNLTAGSTAPFGSTGVRFGASPLALLSDGGLLVGSAGGAGAIYRFDATGGLSGTYASGLGTIGGLVVAPVPEPAAIVTGLIGVVAAAATRRRRMGRS